MRQILVLLPLLASLSACIDIPQASQRQPVRQSTSFFSPRPAERQCLAQLGATHADFTPMPDRYFGGGCSNVNTVRIESLATDHSDLTVSNLGPVTCNLADIFAGWVRYGINRGAIQILGSRVVKVETFGSYSCRTVAGTDRLSAHATANAIDVSAFDLADGRRISVLNDWDGGTPAERRFLRVVHASACKRFGTVLGPNYNAAHQNHFHVEYSDTHFCR